MIRKEIYIDERQEQTIERLARERGVTEAEIVREAIENLETPQSQSGKIPDPEAARRLFETIEEIAAKRVGSARRPRWTRESLYEERMSRWTKS